MVRLVPLLAHIDVDLVRRDLTDAEISPLEDVEIVLEQITIGVVIIVNAVQPAGDVVPQVRQVAILHFHHRAQRPLSRIQHCLEEASRSSVEPYLWEALHLPRLICVACSASMVWFRHAL
jgi:NAD-dependent DNA ligase